MRVNIVYVSKYDCESEHLTREGVIKNENLFVFCGVFIFCEPFVCNVNNYAL